VFGVTVATVCSAASLFLSPASGAMSPAARPRLASACTGPELADTPGSYQVGFTHVGLAVELSEPRFL